ncbi:MAG: PF20097 family protein [Candidatus Bathyarchaeota archaeon]|nr:PF20097 family protein [Candidatus Bathyarchaeota archaeon]
MNEVRKCPKCDGEMEQGCIRPGGYMPVRFSDSESFWFRGRQRKIYAFSCKVCGYTELYTEKSEKKD